MVNNIVDDDRLLNTKETAKILGLAPGTLTKARVYGTSGYPPFIKIGGKAIRYRLSTIKSFMAEQTEFQHTSQAA